MMEITQDNVESNGQKTVVQGRCQCGQAILVETGLKHVCRSDGKRPHYPGQSDGTTVLRCRKCGEWLAQSCPEAAWGGA